MKPSENIRRLRLLAKLNQEDLADMIGKKRATYTQKENGKVPFTVDELFNLLLRVKSIVLENEYCEWLTNFIGLDERISLSDTTYADLVRNVSLVGKETENQETDNIFSIEQAQKKSSDGSNEFTDKNAGKEATENLIKIEKASKREFYKIIRDIKGLSIELEEVKRGTQMGKSDLSQLVNGQ